MPFVFTFTLSHAYTQPVTVQYYTQDANGNGNPSGVGNATTSDGDYQSKSGTITFPAGVTRKTKTIYVNGDTKVEPDELFWVGLRNPVNATINPYTSSGDTSDGWGRGFIRNDDTLPPPTISVNDVSKAEGDSGTTPFVFTFTLSHAYTQPVTVQYYTTT